MRRRLVLVVASVLCLTGVAHAVWFLLGEGLDRAEKWVSITVGVASLALTTGGVWLAWREHRRSPATIEPSTGDSVAAGDETGPQQINNASGQGRVYGVQGGNLIIGQPDDR